MSSRKRAFTLIELLVVLGILGALTGLLLGAVQKARAAAARSACTNNLRQLGLALHHSAEANGRLPSGMDVWGQKYPYASWITFVLPQLDNAPMWADAVADYADRPAFVGPPPHGNLARPLPVVLCPSGLKQIGTTDDGVTAAFTSYLGVSGGLAVNRDGVLFAGSAVRFVDITDGASQTLMVGERPPSPDNHFGWWYAGQGMSLDGSADFLLAAHDTNRTFRAPTCPFGPYPFAPGSPDNMCDTFHFWSMHPGGAHFLYADGSVHFLSYSANDVLAALATRAGGEVVAVPD
jgi:prepilin-type N-terminal cleavage/methylation domain-containing protein/prepilin-type processing-associated H-X9-DG protein